MCVNLNGKNDHQSEISRDKYKEKLIREFIKLHERVPIDNKYKVLVVISSNSGTEYSYVYKVIKMLMFNQTFCGFKNLLLRFID